MQIKGSWKSFLWIAQSIREKETEMIKKGYIFIITQQQKSFGNTIS